MLEKCITVSRNHLPDPVLTDASILNANRYLRDEKLVISPFLVAALASPLPYYLLRVATKPESLRQMKPVLNEINVMDTIF